MKPIISIIVPIYNVEKYLDKCLDSISRQSFKNIEIICVIDASPDNSLEICQRWKSHDNRIKIINEKINKGLGLTRNIGLNNAEGQYVAFVDSDDYIDVNMYNSLYTFAIEHNLDCCFCDYVRDTDGVISISKEPKTPFICIGREKVDEYMYDMLGPLPEHPSDVKHLVSAWRGIYSLEIIKKFNILFESERLNASEDIPFNIDYLMHSERLGYIPFKGYYYRFNPISLSRGYTHQKFVAYKYLMKSVKNKLDTHADEQKWMIHYMRFVFYTFRCIIKYESIKNINGEKFKNIKSRCDDELMSKIYDIYPYRRFHLKQCVFFFCMKHKITWMLYAMSIIENKIHKMI